MCACAHARAPTGPEETGNVVQLRHCLPHVQGALDSAVSLPKAGEEGAGGPGLPC